MPLPHTRYKRYVQFTAEWMGKHWPILGLWTRRALDHLFRTDAQEAAAHDPQPGPTNQGPHPMPATAFPCPPPPAHYED